MAPTFSDLHPPKEREVSFYPFKLSSESYALDHRFVDKLRQNLFDTHCRDSLELGSELHDGCVCVRLGDGKSKILRAAIAPSRVPVACRTPWSRGRGLLLHDRVSQACLTERARSNATHRASERASPRRRVPSSKTAQHGSRQRLKLQSLDS